MMIKSAFLADDIKIRYKEPVLMSQQERKETTITEMPVHHIIVSPITGLLETHSITIKDENQV